MPAAERISIYDANGITGERLISSYVDMCKSPNVPTVAEACLLQLETLIDILQAREKAQQKAIEMGHETPTSACLEEESLREIVSSHFEKGVLNPRSSGTSTGSANQAPDLNLQRKTRATPATITMREPQVPDRKVLTAPSHQVSRILLQWSHLSLCVSIRTILLRRAARTRNRRRRKRQRRKQRGRRRRRRDRNRRGPLNGTNRFVRASYYHHPTNTWPLSEATDPPALGLFHSVAGNGSCLFSHYLYGSLCRLASVAWCILRTSSYLVNVYYSY